MRLNVMKQIKKFHHSLEIINSAHYEASKKETNDIRNGCVSKFAELF